MTVGDAVALIGALMLVVTTMTGSIVALFNTRTNAAAIEKLKAALADADEKQADARKDIILIGEALATSHRDIAALVVLVNQLYKDYERDIGRKPDIDWDTFDRMLTVKHSTNKLGPLQIKDE